MVKYFVIWHIFSPPRCTEAYKKLPFFITKPNERSVYMKRIITVLTLVGLFSLNMAVFAEGKVSSDRTSTPFNIYIAKRGDNLYKIAERYHCTVKQILEQNPQLAGRAPRPEIRNGNSETIVKPNESIKLPESDTMTDMEAAVLKLTNEYRQKGGLKPLQGNDDNLNKSAHLKAEDMDKNNYFSHQSPTLGSPFDQMRNMGVKYNAAGENIADGQRTAEEVMNDWMNSAGHRANIMNGQFTHMGVGYVNGKWCQQFISK